MDAKLARRLVEGAARLGVAIDAEAIARFDAYLVLLLRWNSRIKLTSVVEPEAVVEKHFLDSVAVIPAIEGVGSLVDIGAGAGFPGVPVAMLRPMLQVTLVESIQKKAAFLEALRRCLSLPNVTVEAVRMEALVAQRRQFEAAVSRATFAPAEWVRRGAELVRPGGCLVAMVVPAGVEDAGGTAGGPVEMPPTATLASGWEGDWTAAEVQAPYAPGRALAVYSGRRG